MSTEPNEGKINPWTRWLDRVAAIAFPILLSTIAIDLNVYSVLTPIAGATGGIYASWLFKAIRNSPRAQAFMSRYFAEGANPKSPIVFAAGVVGWGFFSHSTAAAVVAGLGAIFAEIVGGIIVYFAPNAVSEPWGAFIAFLAAQAVYFLQHSDQGPQVPAASSAPVPASEATS